MTNNADSIFLDWFSAMQTLLEPFFNRPAERNSYHAENNVWPAVGTYSLSSDAVRLDAGQIVDITSGERYSVAYPMFVLSKLSLQRQLGLPMVRLLDEVGFMQPEGTLLLDRALQACFGQTLALIESLWLSGGDAQMESVLLRNRLYEYAQYTPEQVGALTELEEKLGLPELDYTSESEMLASASTNAKGVKNIVHYINESSPSIVQHAIALRQLKGVLGDLQESKITNLMPTIAKLPVPDQQSHPMLRDLYFVVINQVVELLFTNSLKKKAKDCLALLDTLVSNKVNLDVNYAKKSFVEQYLGMEDKAARSQQNLLALGLGDQWLLPLPDSRYDDIELRYWADETSKIIER